MRGSFPGLLCLKKCSRAVKEQSSVSSKRSRKFTANSSGTEVHTALPWQRAAHFCCVLMVEFGWSGVQRLNCLKCAAWKSPHLSVPPHAHGVSLTWVISLSLVNVAVSEFNHKYMSWRFLLYLRDCQKQWMDAICCFLRQQIEIMSLSNLWGCGPLKNNPFNDPCGPDGATRPLCQMMGSEGNSADTTWCKFNISLSFTNTVDYKVQWQVKRWMYGAERLIFIFR